MESTKKRTAIVKGTGDRPSKQAKVSHECGVSPLLVGDGLGAEDHKRIHNGTPSTRHHSIASGDNFEPAIKETDDESWFFSKTLPENDGGVSVSFNEGVEYLRGNSFDKAILSFQRALGEVQQVQTCLISHLTIFRIKKNVGYCYYRQDRTSDAIEWYKGALETVETSRLSASYKAAINNVIAVLLTLQDAKSCGEAIELLEESLAIYNAAKEVRSEKVAMALNNIGRVYYVLGNFDKALSYFEDALSKQSGSIRIGTSDVAVTTLNRGQAQHRLGQLSDALDSYKEFLRLAQQFPDGPLSQYIPIAHRYMAEVHHEEGMLDLAMLMYERCLDLSTATLGPINPLRASTLNKLAAICFQRGDLQRAYDTLIHGLSIERLCMEPSNPQIITTLMNIALLHHLRGQYAAAFRRYNEVRELHVINHGAECPEVAEALSNMASMNYNMQLFRSSLGLQKEVLRIRRKLHESKDHPDIVSTLNAIGLIEFSRKRFEPAKSSIVEGLLMQRRLKGPMDKDVAVLCYNLATICLASGDDELAIGFYKESLVIELQSAPEGSGVILTLQHLGSVFQNRGEFEEALVYFKSALENERSRAEPNPTITAMLLNILGNFYLQTGDIANMMRCYVEASRIFQDSGQNAMVKLVVAGHMFGDLAKRHPPGAPAA